MFFISLQNLFSLSRKPNFEIFRYFSFTTSSNAQAQNKKYIFLKNLGRKRSMLMKFDQFKSHDKRKNLSKNPQKLGPENLFQTHLSLQKLSTTSSIGNWNFWSKRLMLDNTYLIVVCINGNARTTFWRHFFSFLILLFFLLKLSTCKFLSLFILLIHSFYINNINFLNILQKVVVSPPFIHTTLT